jgi:hypothetical protein
LTGAVAVQVIDAPVVRGGETHELGRELSDVGDGDLDVSAPGSLGAVISYQSLSAAVPRQEGSSCVGASGVA